MKKLLLILGLMFVTLCCSAQHTYLAQIKNIENQDTAKYCTGIFNQLSYLGIYSVEYAQPTKTFLIKSKHYINPTVIVDYFLASGYDLYNFFETGISRQFIILPQVKDTTPQKPLKVFRK